MTQMLLFNSPADTLGDSIVHDAGQAAAEEQNVAAQLQHESGLHHMGDLARLVLLRYDLVAKRRALMARRKAAAAAK